jgi:hypothetical protein
VILSLASGDGQTLKERTLSKPVDTRAATEVKNVQPNFATRGDGSKSNRAAHISKGNGVSLKPMHYSNATLSEAEGTQDKNGQPNCANRSDGSISNRPIHSLDESKLPSQSIQWPRSA